jgi:hypothetical protein
LIEENPPVCSTAVEAIAYILKHDKVVRDGTSYYYLENWSSYRLYIWDFLEFRPDYEDWDALTVERESLSEAALAVSKRVYRAHRHSGKWLPDSITNGITVRTNLIQQFMKKLQPIREREDYREWKRRKDEGKKENSVQSPQREHHKPRRPSL